MATLFSIMGMTNLILSLMSGSGDFRKAKGGVITESGMFPEVIVVIDIARSFV